MSAANVAPPPPPFAADVDASAIVKLLFAEAESEALRRWLGDLGGTSRHVSCG